ncbi:TetR/AcrR family transcriptional regulator [Salinarimonas soli]|uniref:TetR/AcrR family transcriptional regulator n=1 Tax=Salinarimonas soli TaxID=1638099 RepID=A0A5B2VW28_9HYPH|nr:TetR/AcrR family transcriptional regulator [Salinarimonas soli]KAA2244033.1 TetR/AcrR family transcriptional regulator [Salinarimonas soli]
MTDGSAKPRRRRKEARPAEIIEAGLAEFAEKGFAATRLDDVAARAGIAKGTIYRYFPSKEALFEAALISRVAPMLDGVEAVLADYPGSSADLLRLLLERVHRELVDSDARILMRVIIAEGSRFPAIAEAHYTHSIAKGRAILERIVARGVAKGEFRPGAAADLPMVVIAPALMAAIWRTVFEPIAPIPPERFLAAHLDLVLHGLMAPEGSGS